MPHYQIVFVNQKTLTNLKYPIIQPLQSNQRDTLLKHLSSFNSSTSPFSHAKFHPHTALAYLISYPLHQVASRLLHQLTPSLLASHIKTAKVLLYPHTHNNLHISAYAESFFAVALPSQNDTQPIYHALNFSQRRQHYPSEPSPTHPWSSWHIQAQIGPDGYVTPTSCVFYLHCHFISHFDRRNFHFLRFCPPNHTHKQTYQRHTYLATRRPHKNNLLEKPFRDLHQKTPTLQLKSRLALQAYAHSPAIMSQWQKPPHSVKYTPSPLPETLLPPNINPTPPTTITKKYNQDGRLPFISCCQSYLSRCAHFSYSFLTYPLKKKPLLSLYQHLKGTILSTQKAATLGAFYLIIGYFGLQSAASLLTQSPKLLTYFFHTLHRFFYYPIRLAYAPVYVATSSDAIKLLRLQAQMRNHFLRLSHRKHRDFPYPHSLKDYK